MNKAGLGMLFLLLPQGKEKGSKTEKRKIRLK